MFASLHTARCVCATAWCTACFAAIYTHMPCRIAAPLHTQTGSGKTYTMEGPPSDRGLNFRTLTLLFNIIEERKAEWEFDVRWLFSLLHQPPRAVPSLTCVCVCVLLLLQQLRISLLEIYNETIIDLLTNEQKGYVRSFTGSSQLLCRHAYPRCCSSPSLTSTPQQQAVCQDERAWHGGARADHGGGPQQRGGAQDHEHGL